MPILFMPRARSTSIVHEFGELKREYKSDYEAARQGTRFRRTRHGLYGTADAHYASERAYFEVLEYVRDMERNDPIVKPTLDIVCNQLMKGGFQYDPNTGDDKLDSELKANWLEWAVDSSAVDYAGDLNFHETEKLICRHEIRDGDLFVIPTEDGSLQFHESERARTPSRSERNIVHGIELDRETRRRVRYWFTRGRVDIMQRIERTGQMVPVPARDEDGFENVFHVYDRKRFTQTRGVSAFTSAMIRMGMYEDVEFALVLKQQMAGMLVFTEETQSGGYVGGASDRHGRQETVRGAGGDDYVTEEVSPGLYKRLAPGKTLKSHAPQIPSTETMQHIRAIQQLIGLQVGLPVIMMLMDASETNFSGWRGAVDIARDLFRDGQRRRRDMYHRKVAIFRTRWLMNNGDKSLSRGLRSAFDRIGNQVFRHTWRLPSWSYVQPLHDAQARSLRLSTLQTSPRREAAEEGNEFDEIYTETVDDNFKAYDYAAERLDELLRRHPGIPVTIHHMLNREMPRGLSVTDSLDVENNGETKKEAGGKSPGR